jgi:hypothetical protein
METDDAPRLAHDEAARTPRGLVAARAPKQPVRKPWMTTLEF